MFTSKVVTPWQRMFLVALVPQLGLYLGLLGCPKLFPDFLYVKLTDFLILLYYPWVIVAGRLADALGIRGPGDLGGLRTFGFMILFGPLLGMTVYASVIAATVASVRRLRGKTPATVQRERQS